MFECLILCACMTVYAYFSIPGWNFQHMHALLDAQAKIDSRRNSWYVWLSLYWFHIQVNTFMCYILLSRRVCVWMLVCASWVKLRSHTNIDQCLRDTHTLKTNVTNVWFVCQAHRGTHTSAQPHHGMRPTHTSAK